MGVAYEESNMAASCCRKRKAFNLLQKAEIIKDIEKGSTHEAVASKHGVARSTISTIWKKRNNIKENCKTSNPKLMKVRGALYADLDAALYEWFCDQRSKGISLPGTVIKTKATNFAETLGIEKFSATNGWFDGWKKRHNVSFKKLAGECLPVPLDQDKETWLEQRWPFIRAGYQPNDIFNADETGLFFKMLPGKAYDTKFDKSNGKEKSRERVTLMVCVNMTGTEKLPILLIGKSKMPRGFPVDTNSLPVMYRSNKKAWLTRGIWEEWLLNWDAKLVKTKRRVLLLVDNSSSHVTVPFLRNIEVEYFPSNVTSVLQPMGQGIIRNLKAMYRRRVIEKLIVHLDAAGDLLDLNLTQAIFLVDSAWKSVSSTIISNCFRQAGIGSEADDVGPQQDPHFDSENEKLYAELLQKIGEDSSDDDNFSNYVAVDSEVTVKPTKDEIEDTTSDDEDQDVVMCHSATPDVFSCVDGIREWMLNADMNESVHALLSGIEDAIYAEQMRKRI